MDSFLQTKLQEQEQLDEKVRNSRFYRKVKTDQKMATSRYGQDGKKIEITLNQREYYSQQDIARFNLESYSKLIPDHDGYRVITSTYFVRFWGPVFDYKPKVKGKVVRRSGGIVAYTYIVLKSYCWGKDYCWISIQTLADNLTVSKNAVRGYLEQLEEEGFIIRFWRESTKGTAEDESILIKVRQTIPFLSKEKLDLLPDGLKKEHNDFLNYIRVESEREFEQAYNYTEVYESLREQKVGTKEPVSTLTPYERLMRKSTEKDHLTWSMMKERMKKHIDESSINHWFDDTLVIVDDRILRLYVKTEWQRERIEERFRPTIEKVVDELVVPTDVIKIETYES